MTSHHAGYRLARRRKPGWNGLAFALYVRRKRQLNRALDRAADEGWWPRNPGWRFAYAPLRVEREERFSRGRCDG